MKQGQKLNWTLMLLLLPSLILGLTACSGQSESKPPPATTAEEKEVEAPAPTEETTAAEEVGQYQMRTMSEKPVL